MPWEVLGRSTGGADPVRLPPAPSTVMVAVFGEEAGRATPERQVLLCSYDTQTPEHKMKKTCNLHLDNNK